MVNLNILIPEFYECEIQIIIYLIFYLRWLICFKMLIYLFVESKAQLFIISFNLFKLHYLCFMNGLSTILNIYSF